MSLEPVDLNDSFLLADSPKHGTPTKIIVNCGGRGHLLPAVEYHFDNEIELTVALVELMQSWSKVVILDYREFAKSQMPVEPKMSIRETYQRYVCPECGQGGAHPNNLPIPICHRCETPVKMVPAID